MIIVPGCSYCGISGIFYINFASLMSFSCTTKAVRCIPGGSDDESTNVSRLPVYTLFLLTQVLRLSFRDGEGMK